MQDKATLRSDLSGVWILRKDDIKACRPFFIVLPETKAKNLGVQGAEPLVAIGTRSDTI